jgi:hypothetical protein
MLNHAPPIKNRKVIQIIFSSEGTLYALCDDGSIWWLWDKEWVKMEPPPKD